VRLYELINYVATRGLYFFIADLAGPSFNAAFADAFETYVSTICGAAYGTENVLSEAQERALMQSGPPKRAASRERGKSI
jgi:hypothetical protein